jgi:hypothetical protein
MLRLKHANPGSNPKVTEFITTTLAYSSPIIIREPLWVSGEVMKK